MAYNCQLPNRQGEMEWKKKRKKKLGEREGREEKKEGNIVKEELEKIKKN